MSVVDDFLKFLESPEGRASIEEMIRRDKIIEEVENRWIEKYHNLSEDDRKRIIQKVIDKYESRSYIDKEYFFHNCEPRTPLYWIYLSYTEKYGIDVYDDYVNKNPNRFCFTTMLYKSPEGYFVERIDGQGSVCNIKSENEFYAWLNR